MARPTKEGLEYFPLDTDIDQDEKVIVVIAKYGMRGFGIIIRLMMEIYKNGYYYSWSEREQYVFSMKIGEDAEIVNEIVNECMKWGFFCEEMYKTYGILTSKGFQKRYLLAASRRKGVEIKSEYDLVNVNNNSENANDNSNSNEVNDNNEYTETTQKKRKEIKRKETKDNIPYSEIINYLNDKANKNFSAKSEANKKLIRGRFNEGRTLEDFVHVINVKCQQWLDDPKMNEYLRPSTLFSQKNFENYVNEKLAVNTKVDTRDREIEFQRWIAEGNDPDEFKWTI